jgi:hypothetical protein
VDSATSIDHPQLSTYWAMLCHVWREIGVHFEDRADAFDRAVEAGVKAVSLTPPRHPQRSAFLASLALALSARFNMTRRVNDLLGALRSNIEALESLAPGDPARAVVQYNLGGNYRTLFDRNGSDGLRKAATLHYRAAATEWSARPTVRLQAAVNWGAHGMVDREPATAVAGYETAVELLHLVAWHGLDSATRMLHLSEWAGVAADSCAASLAAEDPLAAVANIERGRSVVWNQVLQLRHDLETLRERRPDLLTALEGLIRDLDFGLKA